MRCVRRALTTVVAVFLALALTIPVLAQDDDTAELLDLRRATQEELADIGRQLDEIQVRKVSEDWVIVRAQDGEYVQVSLERIDELVPWVQMALADQDAAPALLRAIGRRRPDLVRAADQAADAAAAGGLLGLAAAIVAGDVLEAYTKLKAGDIEGVDSKAIRSFIRDFFTGADARQRKADHYAAFEAQLIEQRETLEILLALFDAELAARDAKPSPAPSECTEADMWCDDSDGDIEYDALKGLTECDDGDETCDDSSSDPTTEASLPPTEEAVLPPASEDAPDGFWDGCWSTDIGRISIDQEGDQVGGLIEWTDPAGWPREFHFSLAPLVAGYPDRLVGEFSGVPPGVALECPVPRGYYDLWGSVRLDYTSDGGLKGSYLPCSDDDHFERVPFAGVRESRNSCEEADYRWAGDWQTDVGLLHLVPAGDGFAGTIESSLYQGRVELERLETHPGDPEKLLGRFYGGLEPWLPEMVAERVDDTVPACSETLGGTTHWGDIYLYGLADDEFGGWWAPCDEAWRVDLDGASFAHGLSGQRLLAAVDGE